MINIFFMNKMMGCLVLTLLTANACNKENAVKQIFKDQKLSQTWKYVGYSGGFTGFKFKPQPDANNYLQFDTATFRYIQFTGTSACGSFSVEADTESDTRFFLTLDGAGIQQPQKYDVGFFNDTMTLYPHNFADAFVSYYVADTKHLEGCGVTEK